MALTCARCRPRLLTAGGTTRTSRQRAAPTRKTCPSAVVGLRPVVAKSDAGEAPGRGGGAPLVSALAERARRGGEVPLHVPGHKRGQGVPPALRELIGEDALRHDLTELDGLDYLAYPDGPIREAQRLAARAFGAEATWFLVNGTTCGIQAAVMATCAPGNHLILSRNCHQSAFSALVLSGVEPMYIPSPVSRVCGVASTMTPAALEKAFAEAGRRGSRIGAVLTISPTYFGVCADIASLAQICHSHGVPLLVDEAHGAHLSLHPDLPPGALSQGADIAIQSTHKVLGSMTQSSMLHVQGTLVLHDRVSLSLQTLQSSSPSYILMASLDAARQQAEDSVVLEEPTRAAALARQGAEGFQGVYVYGTDPEDLDGMHGMDPWRLTCSLLPLGLTGFEAAKTLEEDYAVVAELCTQQVVVFAFGIGSTVAHTERLLCALGELANSLRANKPSTLATDPVGSCESLTARAGQLASPKREMSPREAFYSHKERVGVGDAVGRVGGELLCPYPPGIPLIFPGEVVTQAALNLLSEVLRDGGKVLGASDETMQTLLVSVQAEQQ